VRHNASRRSGRGILICELADAMAETRFHIAWFVKTKLERTENIQGWKVKRHSPVRRRAALKPDLPNACGLVHLSTLKDESCRGGCVER
jgi:hypothetical protein